jgi:phage tail-like protein
MNAMTTTAADLPAPARLPPLPAPPHDPYSLLLAGWIGPNANTGWRVRELDHVDISAATCALVLSPAPGAERSAAEPSGTFGGLRLPINAAMGARGEVFLLDPVSGQLLVYDPCACCFRPLPCTTRAAPAEPADPCLVSASQRRVPLDQLRDAQGLALCGGDLFVADAGHGRVVRFTLHGPVPRGELRLPPAERAALAHPWAPGSLAFDGKGRLHVADAFNQRIDRFDARGRWQRRWDTPRRVWHIAFDCEDRLHAVLADADGLVAVAGTGNGVLWQWRDLAAPAPELWRWDGDAARRLDLRSDALVGFAHPALAIDAAGRIQLPCEGPDASAWFDARGARRTPEALALAPSYRRQGRYLSQALDSGIAGCTWHRVELRGSIPAGCTVKLRTFTAEIALDEAELALIDESAWSVPVVATATYGGSWDALIRSLPGRYASLRLELTGDGFETPQVCAVLVEYPRISLRRYLPAVFGAEPASADFTDRFTAIFDATLRSFERRLDRQATLFDPMLAPAEATKDHIDFLSWIASWVGVVLARDWPEARRRRYLKAAARLYALRGTPRGLRAQLLLLLGFDAAAACCPAERPQRRCVPLPRNCGPGPRLTPAQSPALLLEHFKLRRWLFAGAGRLGDDSVLWGQRIVNRSQLGGDSGPPVAPAGCGPGSGSAADMPTPANGAIVCSQPGGMAGGATPSSAAAS